MFLLSLIPQLEELSDAQLKLFKRQVLRVIDDKFLGTPTTESTVLIRPHHPHLTDDV
ncbi:uncharacterized protein LOC111058198 [Nilaparvata lugens]|uniref:uncharacterized protein LOC111058198 n=1 Tax=Nilaparvata lugens TaxID=108931 RepID=UPI000B99AF06|nr:uncharacterized protein LOC111058198 [Nilaparvata lugens]